MSVKERLKRYIRFENLKIKDFEASIQASNGYVNSISKGIGEDKVAKIKENYPNLNIEWLLWGEGSMIKLDHAVGGAYDKVMIDAGMQKAMDNIERYSTPGDIDLTEIKIENDILINKVDFLLRENELLNKLIKTLKSKTK